MPESRLLIEKENPEDKTGELIIVGNHVSTGYFKDEETSKQKFITYEGTRAFKTGDIAFYENGLLFCTGRNDEQIKLNGFRIELDEISYVICENSLILDAVTVALKRNKEVKKIVSFVILKSSLMKGETLTNALLPYLQERIPYYMLPGAIIAVEAFPYNSNHKIDKNKLIDNYLNQQIKTA